MKKALTMAVCGTILVIMSGPAAAEFAKPDDAVHYRKAVMTIIGQHFGRIAAVIKEKTPYNKSKVEKDAVVIKAVAGLSWEAVMVPGSENGDTTLNSSAMKAKEQFMDMARQFEDATEKLAEAAKSGDLNAVKMQFTQVAMNCKMCHGAYRK